MTWLLRIRIAAARIVGLDPTNAMVRATRIDWPTPLAELACLGGDPEVAFDAMASGLAWATALRERHDEAFHRHPGTREWIGTVLARASIEPPETFERELSVGDTSVAEIRGFFEGRV